MITQGTANRISNVCDEIKNCKLAIDLMKTELASGGKPEIFINVVKSSNDDGITVLLAPCTAEEILMKQLKIFEGEYQELNNLAASEVK